MMSGINDLRRESGTRTCRKQYYLIYEGKRTEPGYMKGIKRYRKSLGINDLVELSDVEKTGINESETNIIEMINIADSLVQTIQSSTEGENHAHKRYVVDSVINSYYNRLWSRQLDTKCIEKGEFINILKDLRRKILEDQCFSSFFDEDGLTKDFDGAIKRCQEMIENSYPGLDHRHLDISGVFDKVIEPGDCVCIIRDRDFNSRWYPDEVYEEAEKKIDDLTNKRGLEYRMITTNPQFEFWLLLHDEWWQPNIKALGKSPGNKHCENEYKCRYISYGGEAGIKVISEEMFDDCFKDNINTAIERSEKFFEHKEKGTKCRTFLKNNVGTEMGHLLKEMMGRE